MLEIIALIVVLQWLLEGCVWLIAFFTCLGIKIFFFWVPGVWDWNPFYSDAGDDS